MRDSLISDYGDGDWRHQNACWNGPPGSAGQSSDHCIPTVAEDCCKVYLSIKFLIYMRRWKLQPQLISQLSEVLTHAWRYQHPGDSTHKC